MQLSQLVFFLHVPECLILWLMFNLWAACMSPVTVAIPGPVPGKGVCAGEEELIWDWSWGSSGHWDTVGTPAMIWTLRAELRWSYSSLPHQGVGGRKLVSTARLRSCLFPNFTPQPTFFQVQVHLYGSSVLWLEKDGNIWSLVAAFRVWSAWDSRVPLSLIKRSPHRTD